MLTAWLTLYAALIPACAAGQHGACRVAAVCVERTCWVDVATLAPSPRIRRR